MHRSIHPVTGHQALQDFSGERLPTAEAPFGVLVSVPTPEPMTLEVPPVVVVVDGKPEPMTLNVPPVVVVVDGTPEPKTLKVPPVVVVVLGTLTVVLTGPTAVGLPPDTLVTLPVNCALGLVLVGI